LTLILIFLQDIDMIKSKVVRLPLDTYTRLEDQASGFDTPANVINKLIDYYEARDCGGFDDSGFSGSDRECMRKSENAFYEQEERKLEDTAETQVMAKLNLNIAEMQKKYRLSDKEVQSALDENDGELQEVLKEEQAAVVAATSAERWVSVVRTMESILSKGDKEKEKVAETEAQIKLQSAIQEKMKKNNATTDFISSILAHAT